MRFSKQICPENPKFLEEAYYDATSKPHGYLLFDLKQSTPDIVRYRTSIFGEHGERYIYIPKKGYKSTDSDKFVIINA